MSERMTSIHVPGHFGGGYAEHGRKSVPEMLVAIRLYAESLRQTADIILNALDEDFRVETYVGVHVHKQTEILQEGRNP